MQNMMKCCIMRQKFMKNFTGGKEVHGTVNNAWVKVRNFKNPELSKFKILKLAVCLLVLTMSSVNGQLPKDELKTNQRSYSNLPFSAF